MKRNVQLDRIAGTKVARAKISLEYKLTFQVRKIGRASCRERVRYRGSLVKRNVQLDRIAGTKVARAKISLKYKFTFEIRRGFRVMQYVEESAK